VVTALGRVKDDIPVGATCVMIFPERGERYLDTIYDDEWVTEHFGDVSHLWESVEERTECVMAI
jgi:cysteine synthase A